MLAPGDGLVYFVREYMAADEPPFLVKGIKAIHPDLDAVLLELDSAPDPAEHKRLRWREQPLRAGEPVVTIGYPFSDHERNPLFVSQIFGNRFGVKRLAPGEVVKRRNTALYHDCSTLGGNSGSPVVAMDSTEVVGLHSEGYFLSQNQAVTAIALRDFLAG